MIFIVKCDDLDLLDKCSHFCHPYFLLNDQIRTEFDCGSRVFSVYIPDGIDVSIRNEFCLFFYTLGD